MTALATSRPLALEATPLTGDADPAMVRGCRAGDPGSFRRFVLEHQDLVFAFLCRLVGPGPLAEDLAQEVFLRAYRAFPNYDPSRGAKLSTWLLTIARNAALDALKRRRSEGPLDPETLMDGDADPEAARSNRELGAAIARAASTLGHEQREAFILADCHGLSMEEISGVVGAPVNTVKARLFRARERLRELLASWGEP
jgi:RNA polymerase sigma factor (sigma-70 family)